MQAVYALRARPDNIGMVQHVRPVRPDNIAREVLIIIVVRLVIIVV